MSDTTSQLNSIDENNSSKYKSQQPAVLVFFKTFFICLLVITVILLINANIIYFFTIAPNIINKWFPTDCKKYPFGSSSINLCEAKGQGYMSKFFGGGGNRKDDIGADIGADIGGDIAGNKKQVETKSSYGTLDRLMFGPEHPTEPAFPYKYYSKKYDNVIKDYFSWIIAALINTNIKLNTVISSIFTNETLRKCPSVILLLFGCMLLGILPFIFSYSVLCIIINQFRKFSSTGKYTQLLILFTTFIGSNFILDLIFGVIAAMSLFIKLVFGPLLVDRNEVLRGLAKESRIISFIIGAAFVIALAKTPFNKDLPENLIKGIVIGLYVFFLVVSIIISIARSIRNKIRK